MTQPCNHLDPETLSHEDELRCREALEQFKKHWEETPEPGLEKYLDQVISTDTSCRGGLLIELAKADLDMRIASGLPIDVKQHYLERYPEIGGCEHCLLHLFKKAYEETWENNKEACVGDYLQNVPESYRKKLLGKLNPLKNYEFLKDDTGQWLLLGRGGMSKVYRARQISLGRLVALKMMSPDRVTEDMLRRFQYEGQFLGRLKHHGIATIYEVGTFMDAHGEQPFLAMELINGKPLDKYADAHRLNLLQRLGLFLKICDAVQYAHQQGIIHRDLKPGNILVDESGQPKVLDFGLAKNLSPDPHETAMYTQEGHILGTPYYMSPEQAAGQSEETDTRTDVYTLGVILYRLLTGEIPYELKGKSIHQIAETICKTEPFSPSRFNNNVAGDIETILLKALEKTKESRYQSVTEFADDVRRYLDDEPIQARPATWSYRTVKYCRRHKVFVAGVAAVMAALAVGLGIAAWQWYRAEQKTVAEFNQRIRADKTAQLERVQRKKAQKLADDNKELADSESELKKKAQQLAIRNAKLAKSESELKIAAQELALSESAAKKLAQQERAKADQRAFDLMLNEAVNQWDEGNQLLSLPILTENLQHLQKIPSAAKAQRTVHLRRIAGVLNDVPRLEQMWFLGKPARTVEFSRDDQFVLTAGLFGTAQVWRVADGEPVGPPLRHNKNGDVSCAAFSTDGRFVATGGDSGHVVVWDPVVGKPVIKPFMLGEPVRHVAFSPADNNHLLAAGGTQFATTTMENQRIGAPRMIPITRIGPNGIPITTYIPAGGPTSIPMVKNPDAVARIFDISTGKSLSGAYLNGWMNYAAFSRDGRFALTAAGSQGHGNIAEHWEVDPRRRQRVQAGGLVTAARLGPLHALGWAYAERRFPRELDHANQVNRASFSPDGQRVVTASGEIGQGFGEAVVWDLASRNRVHVFKHAKAVTQASFSPDGRLVVTGSDDATSKIWDAQTGALIAVLQHKDRITAAIFSPDGQYILTAARDGAARIWQAMSGKPATPYLPHGSPIIGAAFSHDCTRIITGCENRCVRIWNLAASEVTSRVLRHGRSVTYVGFSGSDHLVSVVGHPVRYSVSVSGSNKMSRSESRMMNDAMLVWDLTSGKSILPERKHQGTIGNELASPDGKHIITILGGQGFDASSKEVQITNLSTNKLVKWLVPEKKQVQRAGFLSNKLCYVVTGNPDSPRKTADRKTWRFQLLQITTAQTVGPALDFEEPVLGATLNDKLIIFTSATQTPAQGKTNTGLKLTKHYWMVDQDRTLKSDGNQPINLSSTGTLKQVTVSRDGKLILTVNNNFAARVWSAHDGAPLSAGMRHQGHINHAAFSHDSRLVGTAGNDNTARVWDALTGQPIIPALHHEAAVTHIAFDKDTDRVATATQYGSVHIRHLPRAPGIFNGLDGFSKLLTSHHFDQKSGLMPISAGELQALWQKQKAAGNLDKATTEELSNWRRRQANEAASKQNWIGVIVHLDAVIRNRPRRWLRLTRPAGKKQTPGNDLAAVFAQRGHAHAQLKQWEQAAADFATARTLGADVPADPKQVTALVGLNINSKLTSNDPQERQRRYEAYPLNMKAGVPYLIELQSRHFDTFLKIKNAKGKIVAQNDDGGEDLNSRLVFTPTSDGTYIIVATSFDAGATGAFTLVAEVQKRTKP